MKFLYAFLLLAVLISLAIGFVIQAMLFLAFATDSHQSSADSPDWVFKVLAPVGAILLAAGIALPPVLFCFDASWFAIVSLASLGFGGAGLILFVAVICLVN